MKNKKELFALFALVAVLGWARISNAVVCFADAEKNAKTDAGAVQGGRPMHYDVSKMPVPYKINVSRLPAAIRDQAIAEIQAAFKLYSEIPCSTLTFKYMGASTSISYENGAFLVAFLSDSEMQGTGVYYHEPGPMVEDKSGGELIDYSYILMKASYYDIGKKSGKIDIQTAVIQMIPFDVGVYVGNMLPGNDFSYDEIKYDYVNHTLSDDQKNAIAWLYPKTDTTCTKKEKPVSCMTVKAPPKPDSGPGKKDIGYIPTADGSVGYPDSSVDPGSDGGGNEGDGSTRPAKPDDSGCCRVSHAQSTGSTYFVLLGLGIIGFLAFRRRRR